MSYPISAVKVKLEVLSITRFKGSCPRCGLWWGHGCLLVGDPKWQAYGWVWGGHITTGTRQWHDILGYAWMIHFDRKSFQCFAPTCALQLLRLSVLHQICLPPFEDFITVLNHRIWKCSQIIYCIHCRSFPYNIVPLVHANPHSLNLRMAERFPKIEVVGIFGRIGLQTWNVNVEVH